MTPMQKPVYWRLTRKTFIESLQPITINYRQVLAGNNALYAGQAGKTPLYVHALILNSYIESSWKCIDGGSQIAKYLAQKYPVTGWARLYGTPEVKKIVGKKVRLRMLN